MTAALAELEAQVTSREFFTNPYPIYERLREEAPVYWSETLHAWLITRYADVVNAVKDPVRFSSAGRISTILEHLPPPQRAEVRPLEGNFAGGLINSDPPDHTRLRALMNTAFTPRVVENMRGRVHTIVNDLLDAVAAKGEMDVIRDLAYPLPAIVIAEMLGVPAEDRDQFKRWADQTAAFQGSGRAEYEVVMASQQSLLAMREYIAGLAAERRRKPREDLLSRLVAAEEQGQKLTQEELTSTCVTLLIAGHETTTSLIGHGLLALMQQPDAMAELKQDPALITTAIEEFLRYDSPIQRNIRRAAKDFEFQGQSFKTGQLVILMLGAANRDPRQFPNPATLDLHRKENRHLAFGFGIHFCVGAPLARLEGPIAINTVLQRFPELSLTTDEFAWETKGIFRYLKALPVRLGSVAETRVAAAVEESSQRMRCDVAITPDAQAAAEINPLREKYDAFYALVGPHLTVAFPDECGNDLNAVMAQVQTVAQQTRPFTLRLNRWATIQDLLHEHPDATQFLLERFPNAANLIVLLASEGTAEFLQLRKDLARAIPQPALLENYPPYLTLGQSLTDAQFEQARIALRDYHPDLHFEVRAMNFYVEQPDSSWQVIATYALGE